MKITRRQLLRYGAAAGLAAAGQTALAAPQTRPLKMLILGGTAFLGPHIVTYALNRGHTITLFNRGRTNADLFPEVEKLRGDRDGQLDALRGRKWDCVIDTSGYVPRHVRLSATLLSPNISHYQFISTISVYDDFSEIGLDETSGSVGTLEDPLTEQVTGATYGPLKALCEQAAEAAMPGRVCNIRPGLIVGPRDGSDRFTYWPARFDRGGEVLCPGTPDDGIQIIDARDLAKWSVLSAEQATSGVYNATSPSGSITMGQLIEACMRSAIGSTKPTWVPASFLTEQSVQPWSEMPAWFPATGTMAGFASVSVAAAVKAGLTFRPIQETVKDTLAWHKSRPPERQSQLRAGISPEKEASVLAAWAAHQSKARTS